jgi:hypothetical protein
MATLIDFLWCIVGTHPLCAILCFRLVLLSNATASASPDVLPTRILRLGTVMLLCMPLSRHLMSWSLALSFGLLFTQNPWCHPPHWSRMTCLSRRYAISRSEPHVSCGINGCGMSICDDWRDFTSTWTASLQSNSRPTSRDVTPAGPSSYAIPQEVQET